MEKQITCLLLASQIVYHHPHEFNPGYDGDRIENPFGQSTNQVVVNK